MAALLIINGTIITMNPSRNLIADGAVAIEGNTIAQVGKAKDVAPNHKDKKVIDASGKLVLPGFVDGHNHTFHYLSKGIVDLGEATKRLYRVVFPFEAAMTPEEVRIGSLGTFIEMIKGGTTCFNDPDGFHVDSIGEAAREIGIRGIFSRSTWDTFSPEWKIPDHVVETTEEALARAEELVLRWRGTENDRIRAWFSLRTLMTASDKLAKGVKKLADKYGVGIHCHESSDRFGAELMTQVWGTRGIERFRRLGMLGPNLYLVHMGWVNEEEVRLLKENDVKVCHCPSASMFGSMGNISTRMFPRMMEEGITIALGTDAGAISRFLDMVRVMYTCVAGHREMGADRDKVDAYKALEMATIEGARACLWDDAIGSLEPGKRADLIIINPEGPQWHPNPLTNPVANLVYSADGSSVETVIIDGRIVMENRRILTVDEEALIKEADRAAPAILRRAGLSLKTKWVTI